MCGRFNQSKKAEEIRKYYGVTKAASVEWDPSYNIAPTNKAPVILAAPDHERELRLMDFGYLMKSPAKSFMLLNLRSEKVSTRKDLKTHRCIIPATGFYEWEKQENCKQPWFFSPQNNDFFSFAGMWKDTEKGPAFTILTTGANDLVKPVHDRMPVIVGHNAISIWLSPEADIPTLTGLFEPYSAAYMQSWKVSQQVNNPRNKDSTCQNSI